MGETWVKSGYKMMLSSRHPEELQTLARQLEPYALEGTPEEAARFGQVVLLAVPYTAIPQISHDVKEQQKGKILLDATNPWGAEQSAIGQEAEKEGDGVVTQRYFQDVRLVRAFSGV